MFTPHLYVISNNKTHWKILKITLIRNDNDVKIIMVNNYRKRKLFSTNRFASQNKISHLLNLAWGCIKPCTVRKWSKTSLPQGKQYPLKKYTFTSTECILHTFFTFISDSVLVRFTQQYWEKDDLDLTEGQNVHNATPSSGSTLHSLTHTVSTCLVTVINWQTHRRVNSDVAGSRACGVC